MLDLRQGFLPRIGSRNFKAFEGALKDGDGLLFRSAEDSVATVVLDGAWANAHGQSTRSLLASRGIRTLVDTESWRYDDARTFQAPKFADSPAAPAACVDRGDQSSIEGLICRGLRCQDDLSASAYLIPGFVPRDEHDDVAAPTLISVQAAQTSLPSSRPCYAFIGVHRKNIDAARRLIDVLPRWLEGVYIQFTPLQPRTDSPALILQMLQLLRHAQRQRFEVIGGRFAGLALVALSIGISAVDGGLGEGEAFARGSAVANNVPRSGTKRTPIPGGRHYRHDLGMSFSAAEWRKLMTVDRIRGLLTCDLTCCRFGRLVDDLPARGRQHSLHSRLAEARQARDSGQPIDGLLELLHGRMALLEAVNSALVASSLDPLPTAGVENQLSAVELMRESA